MRPSVVSFLVPCVAIAGAAIVVAAPVDRPAIAGSPSFTAIAQEIVASGGPASSPSFHGEHAIGGVLTGLGASSPSFSSYGGVLQASFPPAPSSRPIVFGTIPGSGAAVGGQTITVVAFNLQSSAPGSHQVFVNGVFAPSTGPTNNTTMTAVVPPGIAPTQNPYGPVAVTVNASSGFDEAPAAYRYLPALSQLLPAKAGGCVGLSIENATANFFFVLAVGPPPTAFGVPLPGVVGALQIPPPILLTAPILSVASAEVVLLVPVPAALAPGLQAGVQGVALSSLNPLVGQFTNPITITIE